jgi:hypothetical protein
MAHLLLFLAIFLVLPASGSLATAGHQGHPLSDEYSIYCPLMEFSTNKCWSPQADSPSCTAGCYAGVCLGDFNPGYSGVSAFLQQTCPAGIACAGGPSCPWTLCEAGTFSLPGSSACSPCPLGTLTPPGSSSCGPPCPAGTWSNGNAVCELCPAGTASSAAGSFAAASCTPCSAGLVAPSLGSVLCAPCPPGNTSAPDHASCVPALNASASPTQSSILSASSSPSATRSLTPTSSSSSSGGGTAPQPTSQYAALGASAGVALGVSLLGAVAWPLLLSFLQQQLPGKGPTPSESLNTPLFSAGGSDKGY